MFVKAIKVSILTLSFITSNGIYSSALASNIGNVLNQYGQTTKEVVAREVLTAAMAQRGGQTALNQLNGHQVGVDIISEINGRYNALARVLHQAGANANTVLKELATTDGISTAHINSWGINSGDAASAHILFKKLNITAYDLHHIFNI